MVSQMGGNLRVGLEDTLFVTRRKLAELNVRQVVKIRRLFEYLGTEGASPGDAREILDLESGRGVF